MGPLIIDDVDVSHQRLVNLTRLADQAKPFYDWVSDQFQKTLLNSLSLDQFLRTASKDQIQIGIRACYALTRSIGLPLLFDGIGRSYTHNQACYYFFSWIIRDAPKQRLEPLIQRIARNSGRTRIEVEIEVLSSLIYKYRTEVKTFSWDAVREVFIDRLEGSRRAIKGHEKETVVRTALLIAIQQYFTLHSNYGIYAKVEISNAQIMVDKESFDVSANLLDEAGQLIRRILVPIKTRETEGGGHSHLFTRDIMSAIRSVKLHDTSDYLIVVIVAKNWSLREAQGIAEKIDHLALFDLSPGEFNVFDDNKQQILNEFVASILNGSVMPKTVD